MKHSAFCLFPFLSKINLDQVGRLPYLQKRNENFLSHKNENVRLEPFASNRQLGGQINKRIFSQAPLLLLSLVVVELEGTQLVE